MKAVNFVFVVTAVSLLFSPMVSRLAAGKVCSAYISETVRCRKVILGRDIAKGERCVTFWCDLDLAFYLVLVIVTCKNWSVLYLGNRKV